MPSTPRVRGNARRGPQGQTRPEASRPSSAWRVAAIVTAAGIGVSGYLLIEGLRGASPICLVGSSCSEVASSSFARFLGLPTAAWGFLLYAITGSVAMTGAWRRTVPPWWPLALFGLAAFGATFSAYLVWLQLAVIHALCIWCTTSAVLWAALLVVAFWIARSTV
jgi:uncharacterized membrane protein